MLRPYQKEAFDAIKKDLKLPGASLVVMPTASGKSHVIASTAGLSKQPVLILQPSRELLEQNMEKLSLIVPAKDIGVYSASFGRKEIKKYTFATIQSVYEHADLFNHIPLVLMDEAHGLAPRQIDTMYMQFLSEIGNPKVIGFTATPYRLEIGYNRRWDMKKKIVVMEAITMLKMLNRMRHKKATKNFWSRIIYNIPHKTLLEQGYLSPIEYIDKPLLPYDEIPVNKTHSDYNLELYSAAVVGREAHILSTIAEAQRRYKSLLVFCSTVEQANALQTTLKRSEVVLGDTPRAKRRQVIEDFKSGKVQTVFNVGTLTAGFDYPGLDCVILLRPTRSPLLYNQILGRLTRIAEGKTHGTVIDLSDTCRALGRIETFEVYQQGKLWNLKTEKYAQWHNRCLFSRSI